MSSDEENLFGADGDSSDSNSDSHSVNDKTKSSDKAVVDDTAPETKEEVDDETRRLFGKRFYGLLLDISFRRWVG